MLLRMLPEEEQAAARADSRVTIGLLGPGRPCCSVTGRRPGLCGITEPKLCGGELLPSQRSRHCTDCTTIWSRTRLQSPAASSASCGRAWLSKSPHSGCLQGCSIPLVFVVVVFVIALVDAAVSTSVFDGTLLTARRTYLVPPLDASLQLVCIAQTVAARVRLHPHRARDQTALRRSPPIL